MCVSESDEMIDFDDNTLEIFHVDPMVENEKSGNNNEEKQAQNLKNLAEVCNHETVKRLFPGIVNKQLTNLYNQCLSIAEMKDNIRPEEMEPAFKFAPNESLELQPKFYKTKKDKKVSET